MDKIEEDFDKLCWKRWMLLTEGGRKKKRGRTEGMVRWQRGNRLHTAGASINSLPAPFCADLFVVQLRHRRDRSLQKQPRQNP